MSQRVVVVVPLARDTGGSDDRVGRSGDRIVASLAITSPDGKLVVERAGAPVRRAQAAEDDSLVVGFAAACAHAGRGVPDGLRVRVSSGTAGEYARETVLASTVAGVAASNALLALRLSDGELARIAARIVGSDLGRVVAVLSVSTVQVHHDCDDGLESLPTSTSDGDTQTLLSGLQNDINDGYHG